MSSGSPRMSDRTTEYTRAGAACWANLPPFTADSRLRRVLISTMSAPQASSCRVMSSISSGGIRGFSNSAEPPPDSRNRTVSVSFNPAVMVRAASVAL